MIINSSMRLGIKVLFLATFFFLVFAAHGMALDVTAKTCSKSDVQYAITQVQNAGGGTVIIPTGDCTWSGAGMNIAINGSISIIGAGNAKASPGSNTILRLATETNQYFNIDYNSKYNMDFFRLSNLSLIPGHAISGSPAIYLVRVKSVRLDHLHIELDTPSSSSQPMFNTKNVGKALVDNNIIIQNVPNSNYASYFWATGTCYTPWESFPNTDCYHTGSNTTGCTCSVGSDPLYRSSTISAGNTVIAKLNGSSSAAAVINNTGGSGTGHVQRVYIYINSVTTRPTIDLGSFYEVSGKTLSTRASAKGITVTQGWNLLEAGTHFTAFDINNGDYLGVYLNNCTLSSGTSVVTGATSGTTASAHWILPGNQVGNSNVLFNLATNNVSLWAEIYDTEGVLSACESAWTTWLTTDTTKVRTAGDYSRVYDPDYKPTITDDRAIFFEDNYFQWLQASYEGNWGNIHKVVIRHNQFMAPPPGGLTGVRSQPTNKLGSVFSHVHNNAFNHYSFTRNDFSFDSGTRKITMNPGTSSWPSPDPNGYTDLRHMFKVGDVINISGSTSNNSAKTITEISKTEITVSESLTTEAATVDKKVTLYLPGHLGAGQDYFHMYNTNGLIYDNAVNNINQAWTLWFQRHYGHSVVPLYRQRHLYIFNNTYSGLGCGDVNSVSCVGYLQGTPNEQGVAGYNKTFFFRAPTSGEALYGYADYPYPHPLRLGAGSAPYPPKNVRIINP